MKVKKFIIINRKIENNKVNMELLYNVLTKFKNRGV